MEWWALTLGAGVLLTLERIWQTADRNSLPMLMQWILSPDRKTGKSMLCLHLLNIFGLRFHLNFPSHCGTTSVQKTWVWIVIPGCSMTSLCKAVWNGPVERSGSDPVTVGFPIKHTHTPSHTHRTVGPGSRLSYINKWPWNETISYRSGYMIKAQQLLRSVLSECFSSHYYHFVMVAGPG